MSFLGIDLGTSFIKGAVLNPATRELAHVQQNAFPRSGRDRKPSPV